MIEIPDLVRKTAEKLLTGYCAGKNLAIACGSVGLRYEIEANCLTLLTMPCHPCCSEETRPIARFCYSPVLCQWTLHRPAPGGEWQFYPNAGPSLNLEKLLRHVDEDPLRIFWL